MKRFQTLTAMMLTLLSAANASAEMSPYTFEGGLQGGGGVGVFCINDWILRIPVSHRVRPTIGEFLSLRKKEKSKKPNVFTLELLDVYAARTENLAGEKLDLSSFENVPEENVKALMRDLAGVHPGFLALVEKAEKKILPMSQWRDSKGRLSLLPDINYLPELPLECNFVQIAARQGITVVADKEILQDHLSSGSRGLLPFHEQTYYVKVSSPKYRDASPEVRDDAQPVRDLFFSYVELENAIRFKQGEEKEKELIERIGFKLRELTGCSYLTSDQRRRLENLLAQVTSYGTTGLKYLIEDADRIIGNTNDWCQTELDFLNRLKDNMLRIALDPKLGEGLNKK